MRLVLSRKGFDSANGGGPSPILPDGRMVSLPIPYRAGVPFGALGLQAVMASLYPRVGGLAHADPDLVAGARPRLPGWRPAFGQVGAAQAHLAAQGVGPGDLFLFFGWFRAVVADGAAGWRFAPGAPDVHALFGWLQIGAVLPLGRGAAAPAFLAGHPHTEGSWPASNTVYLARERLCVGGADLGVAGGGVFRQFHPGLQLTAPGRSRRHWLVPDWMGPALSFHTDPAVWGPPENGTRALASVAQGQEFVLPCAGRELALARWLRGLLQAGRA